MELRRVRRVSFLATVIMLLLLTVGLSTATFAWFSANNLVNLSEIFFTADVFETEGDLYIGWDTDWDDGEDKDKIEFANPEGGNLVKPMIPIYMPKIDETLLKNFSFNTSAETDGGDIRYRADGEEAIPCVCKGPGGEESFYMRNANAESSQKVSVSLVFDSNDPERLDSKLVVALFQKAEDGDDFILRDILTNAEKICYGEIEKGSKVSETPEIELAEKSSFEIAPGETAELRLIAWFDGVLIKNDDLNMQARLKNIKFSGSHTQPTINKE